MLTRRALLGGIAAACAGGARAMPDTSVLTAADVHVDGYPTVLAVRWIGEQLGRETGGRLSVRMYHAGQLGREGDTVNLARAGALALTRVTFAALNNTFPATRVATLPYLFDSTAHMRRALDGEVGRTILDGFAARDLVGLALYDGGSRCVYNARHPIHEPADLHGLKLRVPPSDMFMHLVRTLGANPTPLAFGEVFSALQTHLIDGAENNWQTFHTSRQFEVARYWAQTAHSTSPEALLMSRRWFDALSSADRELVLDVARRSVAVMREAWDASERKSREAVLAAGVQVTEIDRAAFRAVAQPVLAEYLQDPQINALYRAVRELA